MIAPVTNSSQYRISQKEAVPQSETLFSLGAEQTTDETPKSATEYETYLENVRDLISRGLIEPADETLGPGWEGVYDPFAIVLPALPFVMYPGDPEMPDFSPGDSPYEALRKNVEYTSAVSKRLAEQYGEEELESLQPLLARYSYQEKLLATMEHEFPERIALLPAPAAKPGGAAPNELYDQMGMRAALARNMLKELSEETNELLHKTQTDRRT